MYRWGGARISPDATRIILRRRRLQTDAQVQRDASSRSYQPGTAPCQTPTLLASALCEQEMYLIRPAHQGVFDGVSPLRSEQSFHGSSS